MIFTSFFFLFIRDQFQLKLVYIFRSKDAFILAVNFEIIWLYFLRCSTVPLNICTLLARNYWYKSKDKVEEKWMKLSWPFIPGRQISSHL